MSRPPIYVNRPRLVPVTRQNKIALAMAQRKVPVTIPKAPWQKPVDKA